MTQASNTTLVHAARLQWVLQQSVWKKVFAQKISTRFLFFGGMSQASALRSKRLCSAKWFTEWFGVIKSDVKQSLLIGVYRQMVEFGWSGERAFCKILQPGVDTLKALLHHAVWHEQLILCREMNMREIFVCYPPRRWPGHRTPYHPPPHSSVANKRITGLYKH